MPRVKDPPTSRVFRADPRYCAGLGLLTLVGVLGAGYVGPHQKELGIVLLAMTGLYLLLLVTMLSLRVTLTADGVSQRWLFSRMQVPWRQVRRLTRTARAYALTDDKGQAVALLSWLPRPAQETIAQETIARARLRPVPNPTPPVLQQWERRA